MTIPLRLSHRHAREAAELAALRERCGVRLHHSTTSAPPISSPISASEPAMRM